MTAQRTYAAARDAAGIAPEGDIHTLRLELTRFRGRFRTWFGLPTEL